MRRLPWACVVVSAVLAAGCEPSSPGPVTPGPDVMPVDGRTVVCTKALAALDAVRVEGTSQRVYALVEDFLNAAANSGDTVLIFQAAQVGDAHRGSAPDLTLEPALTNMVATCAQGG